MIPTNPMRPLTDTAAAVPRVAAATTMSRVRAGWMPSVPASSSPTRSTSSMRRWASSTAPLTHDVGEDQPHVGPRCHGEAAEDPVVDLADLLLVPLLEVGLDGGEQRRHGDAGQHDGAAPGAPPAGHPDQVGRGDGQEPPTKAKIGRKVEESPP